MTRDCENFNRIGAGVNITVVVFCKYVLREGRELTLWQRFSWRNGFRKTYVFFSDWRCRGSVFSYSPAHERLTVAAMRVLSKLEYSEKEAAEYLNVSPNTLSQWRYRSMLRGVQIGPPFIQDSPRCRVRYMGADLIEHRKNRKVTNGRRQLAR